MTDLPVDRLVAKHRELSERIKEADNACALTTAPLKDAQKKIENLLLDYLNQAELDNIRGPSGMAYKSNIMRCSVENRSELVRFIFGEPSAIDIFGNTLVKEYVRSYVDENRMPPPGVKVDFITKVNIR